MKRQPLLVISMLAVTTLRIAAQTAAIPAPPSAPAAVAERVEPAAEAPLDPERSSHEIVRIGQNYTLRPDGAVGQVVVIGGAATIEGRVERDVVVVFGDARLSSSAAINGSLVAVGGNVTVVSGATVRRDLVVAGGRFDAPPEFIPGGQHVVISPSLFGGRFEPLFAWVTRGLLWGRPIVPDLPWVWAVVSLFFVLSLTVNVLFPQPVRACADVLARKPLTTFVVGLLVMLLTGPICLLLAISLIGLAVVPLLFCSLFVIWLVGTIGVARWIGSGAARLRDPESTLQSARSCVVGFAVICLACLVPLLGVVTWTMAGVFGLGACMLTVIAAFRGEHPAPAAEARWSAPARAAYSDQAAAQSRADAAAVAFLGPARPAGSRDDADLASFPHAAFRDRLAAFVLDVIMIVITGRLLELSRRDNTILFLLLAYHIAFWTWKGTTVGGIICQLRIVRVDGRPLRFIDGLVRGLSSIFSLAVFGLGFLWILKDPERQAWHDRIAGTYVVKVPRNWPL